jgi:uncharacterized delta-60 repeat protein
MPRRPTRLTLTPLEDRATPAAAGALDPTFGAGGVITETYPQGFADVTVAPDGRFVVKRPDLLSGARTVFSQGLAQYTQSGALDPIFNTGGTGLDFGPSASLPRPTTVDDSGRVVTATGDGNTFQVSRLTADGKLDMGFGSGGTVVVQRANDPASGGQVNAIAVQPDGKIVLAGTSGAVMEVARLNADGSQDATFADNGVRLVPPPANNGTAIGQEISLMPDGRLVVAGIDVFGSDASKFGDKLSFGLVVRILPDGQLDGGYGTGGVATFGTPLNATVRAAQSMADGTVYVGQTGYETIGTMGSVSVRRLLPSGQVDASYPADASLNRLTGDRVKDDVALLADGQALLLRNSTLQRVTADGRIDTNFGTVTGPDNAQFGNTSGPPAESVLVYNSMTAQHILLIDTAFPTPAGTITVGGTPDGSVTPILPDAAGALTPVAALAVYLNFPGTARVATADVTGDGIPDIVTGPGPGGGPNVVVTDGKTGARIADFNAFETTFTGGVFVAAADLNGDGKAEVVVTPDQGGGPVVAVYDGAKLAAGVSGDAAQVGRFLGIDDENFRGGARPALADLNGDGAADLVVAAGFGGGPRVAVYDGPRSADPTKWVYVRGTGLRGLIDVYAPPKLAGDFFVFEPTLRNGVFVGGGDPTGDGAAELVVGGGPGGGPRVLALDGRSLVGGAEVPVANFFAGDPNNRGGVHVAVVPGSDGTPRLVTGSGAGEPAAVRVYLPATARAAGQPDLTLSPFGGASLAEGVFVG